ncbi:MAG: UDP-N-acetylglucosamine 1-carboxyvinyltransferase [Chloroflexi bacterium]|nr:UDP-N-acetylglucosamine 1-carboxyvinyltransferase [Chloroflexota bacterium]|tara:strand:+ start:48007 stop:49284 length:1278 start_codon:yes stop_codon:yes gene_type:complete
MNDYLLVNGGRPLKGELIVSGSKNGGLYAIAAALLTASPVTIHNIPEIADVLEMAAVCRSIGSQVEIDGNTIQIHTPAILSNSPPNDLVAALRASFLVMGPLLARTGEAICASPGGDVIGVRPLDVHLAGFRALGAEITQEESSWVAKAKSLTGDRIFLDYPSVLGTVNVMFAATLSIGTTTIINAAAEPEVAMVAEMLNQMGANINGHGTSLINITGVKELHGVEFEVKPDRIETGTYLLAGVATGGDISIINGQPKELDSLLSKFNEMGVKVEIFSSMEGIRVSALKTFHGIALQAVPYPGFPTDLHAPMAATLTQAIGVSTIHERVFDNRTAYVSQLRQLGAKIIDGGQTVIIDGGVPLIGTSVRALDIRAGAAVVIGGLAATGTTKIFDIEHLDRGYAHLTERLVNLGADVKRCKEHIIGD